MKYIKLFEDFESVDDVKKVDNSIDDKDNLYSYEDKSDECESCEGEDCEAEDNEESKETE